MAWMGGWFDPELEDLFHGEPELLETAQKVRAARPRVEPDPRFQNRLRAQLVAEASRGAGARGVRRWWRLGPAHFAWGGAFVGAALITATVLTFVSNHPAETVTGFSQLTAQHEVSPNQVITVAFNQPMNEQAVEAGVHIQPAVKVSYSWKNNSLVISPAYHLAANTPYVVSIAQTAIRSLSGASATAPINIVFGTAPTPTPAPVVPPSLKPVVLGVNGAAGSLLFAPDGSVVSTAGVLPASVTTSPSPSPTIATATPSASATPTPEGVITQSPEVPGALVDYPAGGAPVQIGAQAASAAAFSPNNRYLAFAVDDGNGGSKIFASQSNGQQASRLADSATPVTALTWASNDTIVYTDGTGIFSVDLSRARHNLYTLPAASGSIAGLVPGGTYAYVLPAAGTSGSLLHWSTGATQTLQGAATDVTFSGDGQTVAWIDASSSPSRLLTEAIGGQAAPTMLTLPDQTATPSDVTLDQNGKEAAYLSTSTAGVAELVVAQLPSGTPLAIASPTDASQLTLSPGGDQLAFVSNGPAGTGIEEAPVPGASAVHTGLQIPADANTTLQQFVQAQVGQNGQPDLSTIAALSTAGAGAASNTPQNLSRAYIINTYLQPDGSVVASIELIVDPNAAHTNARVASETLLLTQQAAGGYVVSSANTTQLRDESAGPHVVQVNSTTTGNITTLQVSFDSDLDASTVAGAVSVVSESGATVPSTTVYNADTRTATITIANAPSGQLNVDIATSLADFDGVALAQAFTAQVEAGS
ncbi:MAG: Ig-like domain-containing protein [Candidatus Dormibacteria bacterium]